MKQSVEQIFTVKLADNHPACDGHFEGNPLLPGVVTLEYVRLAFLKFYPYQRIELFSKVKFTHALRPGEQLSVSLTELGDHEISFECSDTKNHAIASGLIKKQNREPVCQ